MELSTQAAKNLGRHFDRRTKVVRVYLCQPGPMVTGTVSGIGVLLKDPFLGIILCVDKNNLTHYAGGLNYNKLRNALAKGQVDGLQVQVNFYEYAFGVKR